MKGGGRENHDNRERGEGGEEKGERGEVRREGD